MKKIYLMLFLSTFSVNVFCQNTVNVDPGIYFTASPGTTLGISEMNVSGNSENINLQGNTVLSGENPTVIGGTQAIEFSNLVIDNSSQVNLETEISILNELQLSNGIVNVNDYLILLDNSALISGTFGTNAMIVGQDAGRIVVAVDAPRTIFFPLGDISGTAEYSPAQIEILTQETPGFLSVMTQNEKNSHILGSTDYLNRYWTVDFNQAGNFTANVDLIYNPTDVIGNESLFSGALWTNQWTMFNPVSGNHITAQVSEFGEFTAGTYSSLSSVPAISEEKFEIYRTDNQLYVSSGSQIQFDKLEIFNELGQSVLMLNKPQKEEHIGLSNFSSGVYIVRLSNSDEFAAKKIVIAN